MNNDDSKFYSSNEIMKELYNMLATPGTFIKTQNCCICVPKTMRRFTEEYPRLIFESRWWKNCDTAYFKYTVTVCIGDPPLV